jgi:hypothetical protein
LQIVGTFDSKRNICLIQQFLQSNSDISKIQHFFFQDEIRQLAAFQMKTLQRLQKDDANNQAELFWKDKAEDKPQS